LTPELKYSPATIDVERFGLGKGRARPKLKSRNIECTGCRAPLSVKDERAKMVGCPYCGTRFELTEEQAKAIGTWDTKFEFPLNLGDRFNWKGVKYEVSARIALIEDSDPSELTREYLLYNPRRGTLWLSEYHGSWDLSWPTRVMPKSEPFAVSEGGGLETYDGRKWRKEEGCFYEIAYVDGSLPWVARTGDMIQTAEFSEKSGTLMYEVERSYGELEFGLGQRMEYPQVARALGKDEKGLKGSVAASEPASGELTKKKLFTRLFVYALIAMIVNALLAWSFDKKGESVLTEKLDPQALTDGTQTKEFHVMSDGNLIKVNLRAQGLDNAWMAYDFALMQGDQPLLNVEGGLEYFHGVEGGESWSEGSYEDTYYIKVPKAGDYSIAIQAVGAPGETESAERAAFPIDVTVRDGARQDKFFIYMTIAAAVMMFLGLVVAFSKKEDD
jgi:hypothetical protein